jgi:hypothetical protein
MRALLMGLRVLFSCVLCIGIVRAQELPANSTENPVGIERRQHIAVSSSSDADTLGNRSVYVGATFAPFSTLDESGIRFQLTGNASWYKFIADENPRTLATGRSQEGSFLAGYGISVPRFSVALFTGVAFGEIVNPGQTTDLWGAKAALSFYTTPTDQTMASGWAAYSTIANDLQAYANAGLRIFGPVYFGPEAKFTWRQILPWQLNVSMIALASPVPSFTPVSPQTNIATMRVGAHISALSIGPTSIGISGGWAHDRELGSGYYGGANLYLPF